MAGLPAMAVPSAKKPMAGRPPSLLRSRPSLIISPMGLPVETKKSPLIPATTRRPRDAWSAAAAEPVSRLVTLSPETTTGQAGPPGV